MQLYAARRRVRPTRFLTWLAVMVAMAAASGLVGALVDPIR